MRAFFMAALTACMLMMPGGCSGGLHVSDSAHRGPPVGVDASGGYHEVVAVLPSPGWRVTVDGKRATPDAVRIFVTLRRPNPAAVYTQQQVTQRVLTPIRSDEPVEVYVRQLSFSGNAESDEPYFRVRN